MERKKRRRIFWTAVVLYAVWLTLALRHAIGTNQPLGSLLVVSIVPLIVVVLLWRQGERWRDRR